MPAEEELLVLGRRPGLTPAAEPLLRVPGWLGEEGRDGCLRGGGAGCWLPSVKSPLL